MPSAVVAESHHGPAVKRQKLNDGERVQGKIVQGSSIFAPFRTVGLVSPTIVPFTSLPLGKTTFQITTSVGRCLQTYDLKRGLNLVFLSRPQTPEPITATLAWKDRLFAAWRGSGKKASSGVWVFKRGKKVAELEMPGNSKKPVSKILIFGSWIVAACGNVLEVWKSATYEHYTTLSTDRTNTAKLTGLICNMPTYLNKIFAAREDGAVEIWNVSTGKLVYTIMPPVAKTGRVTAMEPAPALSLLAIAYSEGLIAIHNVRTDKTILQLSNITSKSSITSISFRTDGMGAGEEGRKAGVMATAGLDNGDVTFWDLNNGGRVMGVLRGAHNPPLAAGATVGGGISKVEFLPGQPVIITSGLDNSLKSWIFDESPYSPIPRILHSRSGHAAPVTRLQFLPSEADGADSGGKWLLSAGKDRSLWGWSLRRDGQSTELSQGAIRKKAKKLGILANGVLSAESSTTLEDLKAPEITCMASSLNRDGGMGAAPGSTAIWQKGHNHQQKKTDALQIGMTGWESVVTGHHGDKYARTWFWGRKKAGRWAFETGDGGNVTSVAISPCGTFAVVGSELGGVDVFNLQSGQHRKRFPPKLTQAQARKLKLQQIEDKGDTLVLRTESGKSFPIGLGKHTKAVTGLMVDSLNKHVVSCGLDGKVKFWDFATGNLVDEIDWFPMTRVTSMHYHPASDLIALTCDDMSIRVVDIETKRTIRELWGCQGAINDLCFSNDGRWVIAASQDRAIRVWDLPTGHMIDGIRMATPCTALAFSGTGEFLATACEGDIGVNIWNNKTLFKHVPTKHISENEIADVNAPTVSGEGGQGIIDGAFDETNEEEDTEDIPVQALDQLSKDMMTLSLVPKSRWQTLLHLDLIKQRNKPKEAPKAPEKVPFFLPSLSDPASLQASSAQPSKEKSSSHISKLEQARLTSAAESPFTTLLRAGTEQASYGPFIEYLKALSPSATDLEIRSLRIEEMPGFVRALTERLIERKDYEVVQAWMAVFLRAHTDLVIGGEGVEGMELDEEVHEELLEALRGWRERQEEEGRRLSELVGFCSGVVGFLRSGRR